VKSHYIVSIVVLLIALVFVVSGYTSQFDLITGDAKASFKPQCSDGIDNDGNGYCDFLTASTRCPSGVIPGDPGCSSKRDNTEASPAVCGNGVREGTELCDGTRQLCTSSAGYPGTQQCNALCNGWESCTSSYYCGDATTNGNEVCDYNDPATSTYGNCTTAQGYTGTQTCDTYCSAYSCTSLQYCGDGMRNGNEQCDGSDLAGLTCQSSGYNSGVLSCYSQCEIDTSGCYNSVNTTNTTTTTNTTCTPYWQCTTWSTCTSGTQTRTCTDANNCGTTSGQPAESQSCTTNTTNTTSPPSTNPSGPDLVISYVAYSTGASGGRQVTTASVGDTITGVATLRNQGAADAVGSPYLLIRMSHTKDGVIDTSNGGSTGTRDRPTTTVLGPWGEYPAQWSFQGQAGVYCVAGLIADPLNQVVESNEANNDDVTGPVCITVS
jgi:hypothetical protein